MSLGHGRTTVVRVIGPLSYCFRFVRPPRRRASLIRPALSAKSPLPYPAGHADRVVADRQTQAVRARAAGDLRGGHLTGKAAILDGDGRSFEEVGAFFHIVDTAEGRRCAYPTRLDTYGCGCAHDCDYCYAKALLHFRKL